MKEFYRTSYRTYYQAITKPDAQYISEFGKDKRLEYTAAQIAARINLSAGFRILDVGCAEGTLFKKLRGVAQDLVLVGIEPSREFAQFAVQASGCVTYEDVEDLISCGVPPFDLIVVSHVLEHTNDPVDFLRQLAPLLSSAGKIYVDVPDVERYVAPESLHIAHLFHFSQPTLEDVARRSGYSIDEIAGHDPPHHPPSILAILSAADCGNEATCTSVSRRSGWGAIVGVNRRLPLYLLRIRLGRVAWLSALVRGIRRTFSSRPLT